MHAVLPVVIARNIYKEIFQQRPLFHSVAVLDKRYFIGFVSSAEIGECY